MALSYLTECEAPRDFRVSSTESESHYTKCLLCYTIKKNFYCVECIKAGNFVHSTMPYADKFSEKQAKLLRLKANRKHIQDRCEKLFQLKIKKDCLHIDSKQSRDRIALLKLAIEQRKKNVEERKKELTGLTQYNNELRAKLPKYQKRVSNLGKHAQIQNVELQNKIDVYQEKAQTLAALRRTRIRQLTKCIFPVYITYETSSWNGTDSTDELEFLGVEEVNPVQRPRLHIVMPWLPADGDYSAYSRYGILHFSIIN
ncbi:Beclin 1-associated autophagy-related key regulator [Eumeta japonica]|uniref:Beclin 1-associated autophagy-related key regulator n=1 Tax=Eumeta variegata TaxID=151549 RepID=A0A4C2ACF9_EUMVA|nr:Beclin 1-associated autophagy-related key regulator [Eumeta japonica]